MTDAHAGAPTSRRVALVTGLDTHVLSWGDDAAHDHTVVLLHGFLDLAWEWAAIGAALGRHAHVVAPDLRGHGDTAWVGAGGYYHFFDYVADVDDLVAQLGRARVSIVGHSMGASVAAYWAGTRPARVHRVALLEGLGPPEATADLPLRTASWIDAWRKVRREPVRPMADLAEAAARIRRNDPTISDDDARALAARGTRAVDGGLVWKHDPLHRTMGPYPFRVDAAAAFWGRVTAPVLYLDGDRSLLRLPEPEVARRLAFFPDARRATIAGAGHALMRHQPAAVTSALASFLFG
ncbi:MAG TPA: alpha/beta hydrolase [Kofleriaceae bacterium]|nr:alpha/beta hydrolase [Kofleriaceae bacterium]